MKRAGQRAVLIQAAFGQAGTPVGANIADTTRRPILVTEQHQIGTQHSDFDGLVRQILT
jgi:hypothetical protein